MVQINGAEAPAVRADGPRGGHRADDRGGRGRSRKRRASGRPPREASGVATDITEDTIREIALPLGFVDTKVCAIDETWAGLKLVTRKELR